jgi:hypothetical protein
MEKHQSSYTSEERAVLRSLFSSMDMDGTGKIHVNQVPSLLAKLGKGDQDVLNITEACSKVGYENEGQLDFDQFASILEAAEDVPQVPTEGPDPKVIEFLRILEEYRVKCEDEGNYLEAGRANKQLTVLRKQEELRQQKAVRARQLAERRDVQLAHNMQFSDFNSSWDRYMEEYDNMAQMYIQQMTERHALVLLEYQKQLRAELAGKPPKWSKELLEQRRKQHIFARNKQYAEAEKLKKVSDRVEEREKRDMGKSQAIVFARREAKYRQQQQNELSALLKRIECRRREHIKQRNLDSKRLLQRNKNVQAVLESKQSVESQRLYAQIKKQLNTPAFIQGSATMGYSQQSKGDIGQLGNGAGGEAYYGQDQDQEQNMMYDEKEAYEGDEGAFEPSFLQGEGPTFMGGD